MWASACTRGHWGTGPTDRIPINSVILGGKASVLALGMLEPLLSPGGRGRGLLRKRANGGHSEGWTAEDCWLARVCPSCYLSEISSGD